MDNCNLEWSHWFCVTDSTTERTCSIVVETDEKNMVQTGKMVFNQGFKHIRNPKKWFCNEGAVRIDYQRMGSSHFVILNSPGSILGHNVFINS